uniref:Uncharacterized protein n=1 Tax=Rhizophora mucronata TaxID=61149 RepID=A0A2P2PT09_RHIMU
MAWDHIRVSSNHTPLALSITRIDESIRKFTVY